jgi:hypothetical protein
LHRVHGHSVRSTLHHHLICTHLVISFDKLTLNPNVLLTDVEMVTPLSSMNKHLVLYKLHLLLTNLNIFQPQTYCEDVLLLTLRGQLKILLQSVGHNLRNTVLTVLDRKVKKILSCFCPRHEVLCGGAGEQKYSSTHS